MLGYFRPSFLPRRSLDWDCYELGLVREHGPHLPSLLFIVELQFPAALQPTDDQMNARSKVQGSRSGFISIHPVLFSSLMALAGFSPISLPLTTFQQDLPLPCSQLSPLSFWASYLSTTYFLFLLFCLFFSLSPSLALSRLDINLPLPKVEVNL